MKISIILTAISCISSAIALPLVTSENEAYAVKRQITCLMNPHTRKIGNGNPHQKYLHKQLSQPLGCGQRECAVGAEQSKSYEITFSAEFSPMQWISGGFAVTQAWTTGQTHTCYGKAHDTVCIWQRVAHTAYTIQDGYLNSCNGEFIPKTHHYVIKSPNKKNLGGKFYCVIKTCRAQGDQYWEEGGCKGGPRKYCGNARLPEDDLDDTTNEVDASSDDVSP